MRLVPEIIKITAAIEIARKKNGNKSYKNKMAVRMTKVVLVAMQETRYTITRTLLATGRINTIVRAKFRIEKSTILPRMQEK